MGGAGVDYLRRVHRRPDLRRLGTFSAMDGPSRFTRIAANGLYCAWLCDEAVARGSPAAGHSSNCASPLTKTIDLKRIT